VERGKHADVGLIVLAEDQGWPGQAGYGRGMMKVRNIG